MPHRTKWTRSNNTTTDDRATLHVYTSIRGPSVCHLAKCCATVVTGKGRREHFGSKYCSNIQLLSDITAHSHTLGPDPRNAAFHSTPSPRHRLRDAAPHTKLCLLGLPELFICYVLRTICQLGPAQGLHISILPVSRRPVPRVEGEQSQR